MIAIINVTVLALVANDPACYTLVLPHKEKGKLVAHNWAPFVADADTGAGLSEVKRARSNALCLEDYPVSAL